MTLRERKFACLHGLSAALLLLVAGCADVEPVDSAVFEAEQRRILSPFQPKQTIVADTLKLVLSANFWLNLVQPATSERLRVEQNLQVDGGKQVHWSNVSADHMLLSIDNTQFVIMKTAHIEVLGGTADLQLSASAQGNVFFPRKGADRKMITEVVIENGSFRSR